MILRLFSRSICKDIIDNFVYFIISRLVLKLFESNKKKGLVQNQESFYGNLRTRNFSNKVLKNEF